MQNNATKPGTAWASEGQRLDAVRVVVAAAINAESNTVQTLLRQLGIGNCSNVANTEDLGRSLRPGDADLLICDVDLPGDPLSLIRELRRCGDSLDPFIPVILLAWRPNKEIIQRVVRSGADNLLILPLAGQQLSDAVDLVANARKPFLVTVDYIGPDHRGPNAADRSGQEIAGIDVPNPLRGRINGTDELAKYDAAKRAINDQRIERCAFQIRFLTRNISEHYEALQATNNITAQLDRLLQVVDELEHLVVGTAYAHLEPLCHSMPETQGGQGERSAQFNWRAIDQVSQAIRSTFESAGDAAIDAAFAHLPDRDVGGGTLCGHHP